MQNNENEIYDHQEKNFLRDLFLIRLFYRDISPWMIGGAITAVIITYHYSEIIGALNFLGLHDFASRVRTLSNVNQLESFWFLSFISIFIYAFVYEFVIVAPVNLHRKISAKLKGKKYFYNYFGKIIKA